MRIERTTHETTGSEGESGHAPARCADAPVGNEPLRLPANHLHLMRVFHGAPPRVARAAVSRSLSPDARRAIRRRLLDGSYASPKVIDELARRLLAGAHL